MNISCNSFSQSLPDGPESKDISNLMRHVATTVEKLEDEEIDIIHLCLHEANATDNKPSISVYHSGKNKEGIIRSLLLKASEDKRTDIPALLEGMAALMRKEKIDTYFDFILEDQIDADGSWYSLTAYFSE
jgi:hypothetical protein